MRILCITPYYKPAYIYGGPARTIPTLCEGLAEAGTQVTVFTTNANGSRQELDVSIDQPVQVDGVEVHYFARSRLTRAVPFYASELGKACQTRINHFDVIYLCATWTYPMFTAARIAQSAGVPYVVSPMGALMKRSLQEKWLKKRLYFILIERKLINHAAAIRCTSVMEQQQTQRLSLRPRSVLIPEALDLKPFMTLPGPGRLRKMLGLTERDLLTVFIGRLAPEKRLDLTVAAFAKVRQQLPEAHLAIIGPEAGSDKSIRQQVGDLGISDRVHFVGPLAGPELLQVYVDADLLVLLSRRENFGMVAVEAMAAGLPVLLSDQVGLAEEVRRAGAGYVVSSQVDEITPAWSRLLSGNGGKSMGARGRELVERRFSQQAVAAQMLDLLRGVSTDQEDRPR